MEKLTDQHIKEFLEQTPLYTWKEFSKPVSNRSSLWISEIDAFCEHCSQSRPFQDLRSRGSGSGMSVNALATGTSYFQFSCVSCRKQKYEYLVEQVVTEETIKIQKYGELPRKNMNRDEQLKKFFSNDFECYEKAIVCIANGYGIAGFAYMRRIIESNIQNLLDMLREDNENSENTAGIEDALSDLQKESPMSKKIKIANNALPEHLKPDGLNPLGRLYQVLSEGIHNYSDEECLKRANVVMGCIKFLVSELTSRKRNRDSFKGLVGKL